MSHQDQFLNVIDRDEAESRFRSALTLKPLGAEVIALTDALGRVLSEDVLARVDVPSFDRSNFDGFALRAADTFGATEIEPKTVRLLAETLDASDWKRPPVASVLPGNFVFDVRLRRGDLRSGVLAGQETRVGQVLAISLLKKGSEALKCKRRMSRIRVNQT